MANKGTVAAREQSNFRATFVVCFGAFALIVPFFVMMAAKELIAVEFEVYGVVQGVFFRKYTQQQATSLGIRGWCMNTERGTVRGIMEGEVGKVKEMKQWLQHTGSPSSKIEKAEFKNEKNIKEYSNDGFSIKH